MKTLIATFNSKYIHTSLALRLLYVASYKQHDVDFKEYTIKDKIEDVCHDVLSQHIDILALSTYIWNVNETRELARLLKQRKAEIIIILGGPEVTYEPEYFLKHFDIDYVLSGEGEQTFPALLNAIENQEELIMEGVSYKKDGNIITQGIAKNCDLSVIEALDSPYLLERDLPHMKNRIVYFESSRGCPYQCQYCLSSLEKGVRFFSDDYIKQQLKGIIDAGAKTIKFLDRSFNVHPKKALTILQFIVENHRLGQQFQFEINADVLDQRIIDYVNEKAPKNLLRFEIGIQSTYEPTNEIVKRRQDFTRLSKVIKDLNDGGKADLHLDLIAGLPHESYNRFKQSFNDVFAFRAKELQLGFLKLLRGTSLRNDASIYEYDYDQEAPYEIISNHVLSNDDRQEIHIAEEMLEKYWNSGRFYRTLNHLFDYYFDSPFDFFHDFGHYYMDHGFKMIGYQINELFIYLKEYLETFNIHVDAYLLEDYFLLFKVKPKRWWVAHLSHEQRNQWIHELLHDKALLEVYDLNQDILFRYSMIEKIDDLYFIAIYKDYQCRLIKIKQTPEGFVCVD